jgi:hypothetical protein
VVKIVINTSQWIGLVGKFYRKAPFFLLGQSMVSGSAFPLNQSIEIEFGVGLSGQSGVSSLKGQSWPGKTGLCENLKLDV